MKKLFNLILKLKYSMLFRRKEHDFDSVEQFCIFAGYPRSGHSLVGALMDAHPEMIISHELDVLDKITKGFSYRHIYAMIIENSRKWALKGRKASGYNYSVKGQWQGRYRKLKIIGDKRGGRTTMLLSQGFHLLEKLKEELPVPLRIIHVVRNPFDNIVTRAHKGREVMQEISPDGIRNIINRHFEQADLNMRVISDSGCHVLTIKHEELISNPRAVLIDICDFLGIEAPMSWVKACAAIVFEKPHKTRFSFDYSKEQIDEINEKMEMYPFFQGYSFDS
jgi:hypothetical protein